jgi:hypothetical protein
LPATNSSKRRFTTADGTDWNMDAIAASASSDSVRKARRALLRLLAKAIQSHELIFEAALAGHAWRSSL